MSKQSTEKSSLLGRLEKFSRENTKLKYEKPDYEFWIKSDYWKLGEAVFLISGIEPVHPDIQSKHFNDYYYWDETSNKLKRIYDLAIRSIASKKLEGRPALDSAMDPVQFVKWSERKELPIPNEFKCLIVDKKGSTQEPPPYLNPNNKYYSEELAIAVKAWLAHFVDDEYLKKISGKRNKQFKSDIEKWLTEQNRNRSGRAIERIVTVVNPKKSGGSQATE